MIPRRYHADFALPPAAGMLTALPEHFARPGVSLPQLVAIFQAYRWLIIAIVAAVLAVTVLVVALLPRTYASTATLGVSYDVNDPLNGEDFPVGLLGSYIATQIELMQTPEVLLPVVDRLQLTGDEDYTTGYRSDRGTLREWAASRLRENLAIYQGPFGSHLIHVTVSARSAPAAAALANTLAEVYLAQDRLRSTQPAQARARQYAEQLAQLKTKVNNAQHEVTAFRQRNALIDSGLKADVDIALLADLEQQSIKAQNSRRSAEARNAGDQSVGDQVLASPLIQGLKAELATQLGRLAELELNNLPQYRPMIELQAQIRNTRAALAAETARYSSNAAAEVGAARQLERKLQAAVDDQHRRVLAVSMLHDEAAKYQLELESTQAVYRQALEGYDRVLFASSSSYSSVAVVSRARPPVKPSKPRVLLSLAIGAVVAGLLGLLGPFVYEMSNRRVRCRDDLEQDHAVPVLAEFGHGARWQQLT